MTEQSIRGKEHVYERESFRTDYTGETEKTEYRKKKEGKRDLVVRKVERVCVLYDRSWTYIHAGSHV